MAIPTSIEGDLHVRGRVTSETMTIPASTITDAMVASNAAIAATKQEHRFVINYSQADGSDVVAAIVPVYVVHGTTATLISVEVVCIDAPEGGDKTFTVDLKKCNVGSPAPATVLTGVIAYAAATPDCTIKAGTFSSTSLANDDTLVVAIAVSGSTGNQGQGLIVTVTLDEDAS